MQLEVRTAQRELDKYNAYMTLCEAAGLQMLINGTEKEYIVENGILYHINGRSSCQHRYKSKKVYSRNPRKIMLFENLLALKSIL